MNTVTHIHQQHLLSRTQETLQWVGQQATDITLRKAGQGIPACTRDEIALVAAEPCGFRLGDLA